MTEQDSLEKVQRYETFLNERLRGDLRKCLEQRDKIYEEQAEFLALRNSIQGLSFWSNNFVLWLIISIIAIKTAELVPGEPLKTKVDLGCNFYCQVLFYHFYQIFLCFSIFSWPSYHFQRILSNIEIWLVLRPEYPIPQKFVLRLALVFLWSSHWMRL